jgi:hypothetical protein
LNIYKEVVKQSLPRLFALYDLDPCSNTRGFGDREYWGWKIKDFANGTFQGGVHALAIAIDLELIERIDFVLQIIDKVITAISRMKSRNGSLSESYPEENSFCVTALVAFDVLSTIRRLGSRLHSKKKSEYLAIIEPLIRFITLQDEKHAIISNHLATAVAAMELWYHLTDQRDKRAERLLNSIYRFQSNEGWYQEYEGADPGYQTLCTYYLFCAYELNDSNRLFESLKKSVQFLKYFIHPDSTIGGLYGSRNTEVYYPAGLVGLAAYQDDFRAMEIELRKGIAAGAHILPQAIDSNNFIPLLNAYAVAALYFSKSTTWGDPLQTGIPCRNSFEKYFNHAGIFINSTTRYYAILNFKKGGTLKVFDKSCNRLSCEDGGLYGRLANGKAFSTQSYEPMAKFENHTIKAAFHLIKEPSPTSLTTIIIRLLVLTVFRSPSFGNFFKRRVVKLLMTGGRKIDGWVNRRFEFGDGKIRVIEKVEKPKKCKILRHTGKFRSIHMASSGYFTNQLQDANLRSALVEFTSK